MANERSYFINKKITVYCNIHVRNFDKSLTNDIVNFEQLTPGLQFLWH